MTNNVLVITGPTASGKSGLALAVAKALNGVIINADSMQIYKDLPTLTAQPDQAERAAAPHALYGVLAANETIDAARWSTLALAEINDAKSKKHLPIIVGGTGFYIKALIEGFSPIPEIPPHFREGATKILEATSTQEFYHQLLEKDPLASQIKDTQNPQRLMRAWEVFEATGKSLIDWQKEPKLKPDMNLTFTTIGVCPPREDLYKNCNARFDLMLKNGALDEVRELQNRISNGEVSPDSTITKAIGFTRLCAYLKDTDKNHIALAQQDTRRYAKRQMTWLRNQMKGASLFNPSSDNIEKAIESIDRLKRI